MEMGNGVGWDGMGGGEACAYSMCLVGDRVQSSSTSLQLCAWPSAVDWYIVLIQYRHAYHGLHMSMHVSMFQMLC